MIYRLSFNVVWLFAAEKDENEQEKPKKEGKQLKRWISRTTRLLFSSLWFALVRFGSLVLSYSAQTNQC